MRKRFSWALVLTISCGTACLYAADPVAVPRPVRFILHGNMSHDLPTEEYLRFVETIKPDILVMGVFDQRLYSLAVPPSDRKPTLTPDELLARWKDVTDRLHRSGIRLIGQMELNVVSDRPLDLEQRTGWIGYYEKAWDAQRLGPRPTRTAAELLEQPDLEAHPNTAASSDSLAKCGCRVNTKALRGCINKPAWRDVQKRLVRAAVDSGVDGFITNRNYFGHCACEHCVRKFRQWLGERYAAEELKTRFGIANLADHPLSCVVGMHRDIDTVPTALVLEKQRFAKFMIKEFFDEVYMQHGRQLRRDLFVGQWNHMAYFDELHLDRGHLPPSSRTTLAHGAADERWGLPLDLWGKGEDLLWYCNWGTAQNTILDKGYAGDTTLYGKLLRTLAQGKAYVINKYDFYRPRNMMAEAAALGYATNAIATPWQTEEDRTVMIRYFAFLKKHADLYQSADSYAEAAVVFPRRALHAGDASPLEYVEAAGRSLVREHVLFDVLPDDMLARLPLERYRVLVVAAPEYLEKAERDRLAQYTEAGGKLLVLPVSRDDRVRPGASLPMLADKRPPFEVPGVVVNHGRTDRTRLFQELVQAVQGPERLSRFEAPWTVEVTAYHRPMDKQLVLHFVNYNHQEKAVGKSVSAREAPIEAEPVKVRLRLPVKFRAQAVRFYSPDDEQEHILKFQQHEGVLEFTTPKFLVYGLCAVGE